MDDTSENKRQRNFLIATFGLLVSVPLIWHGCGGYFGDDEIGDEDGDEIGEEAGGAEGGGQGAGDGDGDGDRPPTTTGDGDGDGDGPPTTGDGDGEGRDEDGTCVALIAGQHTKVGKVCVSVDYEVETSTRCDAQGTQGVVKVVYKTYADWELKETHFVAGDEFGDIPINSGGNPQVGQFPYSAEHDYAKEHRFDFPLCELGLDGGVDSCEPLVAFFAAHAVVHRGSEGAGETETAWGDGERIAEQGSWAMYFNLKVSCGVEQPPVPERCESAFAQAATRTCFSDYFPDEEAATRWGWTNGPIAPGAKQVWPVLAAAGSCEGAGTEVGKLDVEYLTPGIVNLRFEPKDGIVVRGEHLYLGNEPLPRDSATGEYTLDPSLYGLSLDQLSTARAHSLEGYEGELHVVYHAVACGKGLP